MLLAMPAGELLGIGDLHSADRLAVRAVGIADRVLPATDRQVTRSADVDVFLGRDVGGGQADITLGGGHAHASTHRQLGTGDGVALSGAIAACVVGAERQACGVGGDAPTLATAVAATTLGVVRDIEDDVLGGQQDSVALGRHLRALAGDGTTVGNE
ncbi:hypothetical protein G6F32_014580 [Rhizopus arrhizus]|nr:hypothetical protein G6F32_014580 [Rhizopus arrhizus]